MRLFPAIAIAAVSALTATALPAATPAPRLPIASFDQLAKPLPLPYPETGSADAAIAAARARASKSGKLLLIDLGGNWCLDCRILAGTMEVPQLKTWLAGKYEIVTVNVGRFDKNLQIPAHYGITSRLEGVPSILIVNPRTDRLVNRGKIAALADARSMTPQALADWLAQWVK